MKPNNIDAQYYEQTDFSNYMKKNAGKRKVILSKRITINIPSDTYDKANAIDQLIGTGYQNVLKTAMGIGINKLFNDLSDKKKKKS